MKMSKPGLCCDDCFALIAKRSPNAAIVWADLCEIQSRCEIFGLKMEDNPTIQLLESLGFLTSTEIPGIILIKIHGQEQDPLGSFFCGGNCGED
jgi:hypothetical protein